MSSAPRLWMTFALALLAALASACGLFLPSTYGQETIPWAAQLRGGDAVTLLISVPVLLVSAVLSRRGSVRARAVWQGSVLLFLYNYAIFAFAVHFNALFPAYCGVLGLSFYALLESLVSSPAQDIAARYPRAPVRTVAIVFFVLAGAFAALGLGEVVPAVLAGGTPKSITECGLLTNPVHVLDLSFFLPAFVITGVLLWRRRPLGFVLAPVLMVFGLLMTVTVAGLMVATARQGLANDYFAALPFLGVAVGFSLLLGRFLGSGTRSASR